MWLEILKVHSQHRDCIACLIFRVLNFVICICPSSSFSSSQTYLHLNPTPLRPGPSYRDMSSIIDSRASKGLQRGARGTEDDPIEISDDEGQLVWIINSQGCHR
jgi:hypothetical protein